MSNKLGVAISTWNRAVDLERCLSLLFKQTYNDFEVYVVDNCSVDDTVEVLKKFNLKYEVMLHSNFSAIYTINRALQHFDTEYVLILDDDTFLEDIHVIQRLMETAYTDPNIAIVATNVRDHNNNVSLILKTPLFDACDYNQVSNHDVFDIDDFSGACALFKREFVGPGFYDETFKLYWNEPELAIRTVANGHRVVVNQKAVVIHGSNVNRESCRSFYFGSRNTFRLMTKVLPVKYSVVLMGVLLPFHIVRYINMRHEKNFLKYLPKLIGCYLVNIWRCVFAKRITFNDGWVQRRVYNTYFKYFLKELIIYIGV